MVHQTTAIEVDQLPPWPDMLVCTLYQLRVEGGKE